MLRKTIVITKLDFKTTICMHKISQIFKLMLYSELTSQLFFSQINENTCNHTSQLTTTETRTKNPSD